MSLIKKILNKIFKKGNKTTVEAVETETVEDVKVETPVVETEAMEGVVEEQPTHVQTNTSKVVSFNKMCHVKYNGKQKRLEKRNAELQNRKDVSDKVSEICNDEAFDKVADARNYLNDVLFNDKKGIVEEMNKNQALQSVSEEDFIHIMQLKSEKNAIKMIVKMLNERKKTVEAEIKKCPETVKEFAKGISPILPSDLDQTVKSIESKVGVEQPQIEDVKEENISK